MERKEKNTWIAWRILFKHTVISVLLLHSTHISTYKKKRSINNKNILYVHPFIRECGIILSVKLQWKKQSLLHSPYRLPFCNLQTSTAMKRGDNSRRVVRSHAKCGEIRKTVKYPWSDHRIATCHYYSLDGCRFDDAEGHWDILPTPRPELLHSPPSTVHIRCPRFSSELKRLHIPSTPSCHGVQAVIFSTVPYNNGEGSPYTNW
jgi:hypothetical protein